MPEHFIKFIPLTQGLRTIVDDADFEWLSRWNWCAMWDTRAKDFSAIRGTKIGGRKGRRVTFYMHREILGLKHGDRRVVDHINHDALDNRRKNLRIATRLENAQNRNLHSNNTSGYKGVIFSEGLYKARIRVKGKLIYLGSRKTARTAYKDLYVPAALKFFGRFARVL
jgi:hypothetical protein